ncbi:S-methyl-5-thioribose-1-phosphate isomerase [Streptomyces sp. NPDC090135]|uniref:S-methyl-5-thioribose-1-phosphate isomerase n=1 Tax=Streptomyces sp. NPDC090135 TaxID=3365957 RepID=UPI003813B439
MPNPEPPSYAGLKWTGRGISVINQLSLPETVSWIELTSSDEVIDAIRRMVIRGAPAIGSAGAYAVALATKQAYSEGWSSQRLNAAIEEIKNCRPTAVNLYACVNRAASRTHLGFTAVLNEAHEIIREDILANHTMAVSGADFLEGFLGNKPLRLLTHCNTGHMATAGGGTALGVIRELDSRSMVETVYVNETRPLLQGSRLTSWELMKDGIPHKIQVDGATAGTIVGGHVDAALVGADRVAANGDFANKVGTLGIALACSFVKIPLIVVASTSTVDVNIDEGGKIKIEMRDPDEVTQWPGSRITPVGAIGYNPAFDVTPARLVTALVTEHRVLNISAGVLPRDVFKASI